MKSLLHRHSHYQEQKGGDSDRKVLETVKIEGQNNLSVDALRLVDENFAPDIIKT